MMRCLTALVVLAGSLSCGPSPAAPGPTANPLAPPARAGSPASEPRDEVEGQQEPSDIRTPRWPRAGKPALCEQRFSEDDNQLQREVERAIDLRGIGDCHRRYKTIEPIVELSFTVAEDGRIVIPNARGVDYMLAACIERTVEDACVGTILDKGGKPIAVPFTIEMYLTR